MHNRTGIIVYSFIISMALHLVLFVPWSTPEKIEKKPETIPVSFRTIAKQETEPPAPEKAKDEPKRAKGLPLNNPPAVSPPQPPAPPPPPPRPPAAKKPAVAAPKAVAPPPPPPEPKVEPAKPPPPPVAKKLAPAKDGQKPPTEKVVEKKAEPKPKKVATKKKTVTKKKVAKKSKPRKKTPQKEVAAKKRLPTLKELLPPVSGSSRASSGTHGNEYISMDSRDPKYSSWLASLQRDIYRTWLPSYPRGNIRGEVLLGLMIQKDGDLAHVEVLRSSGLGLLDRHAMEAVRAASPFSRFPPWMTQDEQGIKATFTYGGSPGSVSNWMR